MNVKKYAVRLGLLGLASAIALPAIAQTYNGNTVYKVTRSNGSAQVVVANRTPGERLTISYPGAISTRRVTANACGLVVLRDSATIAVSGRVRDTSTQEAIEINRLE
jgi:hypothetical protein